MHSRHIVGLSLHIIFINIFCVCVLLLVQSSLIAFLPQGCCQHERVVDAGTELRSSKRKNIKRVSDGKGGAILASNKRLHETR